MTHVFEIVLKYKNTDYRVNRKHQVLLVLRISRILLKYLRKGNSVWRRFAGEFSGVGVV